MQESVLASHHVGLGNQTQVKVRLGCKYFYLLSHLPPPIIYEFIFEVLGNEPRTLYILSQPSSAELPPTLGFSMQGKYSVALS